MAVKKNPHFTTSHLTVENCKLNVYRRTIRPIVLEKIETDNREKPLMKAILKLRMSLNATIKTLHFFAEGSSKKSLSLSCR